MEPTMMTTQRLPNSLSFARSLAPVLCALLACTPVLAQESAPAAGASSSVATTVAPTVAPTAAPTAASSVSPSAAAEPAAAPQAARPIYSNTVRLGYYFIHYSASADDLSGPFTPSGINLRVARVNTPFFAYLRRLSPHFDLEIAAGVPPTTRTYGVGPNALGSVPFNGLEVDTARWFSPTVLLDYKFFDESASLRPFVGAGFNYTHFYERDSTAAGNAANGGPTQTFLSDSFGPAGTAGLAYRITDRISATASFSLATVKSNYDSVTSGISRTTSVNFHPTTWILAVGYSF
jgi:outer membrane protein